MSSDSISYFDWSLKFKKKSVGTTIIQDKPSQSKKNSLGIDRDVFKSVVEEWKRKNL